MAGQGPGRSRVNGLQMAEQLKFRLATVVWPSGSGQVVFGSRGVYVFAGTPNEEQIPPGFPWALVSIGRGTPDREQPTLLDQPYTIVTAAEVAGDPLGEMTLIGGPLASDGIGRSANRGVLEIAERVHACIADLTGADGAPIVVALSGPGAPSPLGKGRHCVLHEHEVRALVTTEFCYAAPQNLRVSGGTGLAWSAAHCWARYDYVDTVVVAKAGSAPTSVSDGSIVYTDSARAGAWSGPIGTNKHSVFARYNARSRTVAAFASPYEVGMHT